MGSTPIGSTNYKNRIMIVIMKPQSAYFGFDSKYPAVCSQANDVDTVVKNIIKYKPIFLKHMKTQSGGNRLGA